MFFYNWFAVGKFVLVVDEPHDALVCLVYDVDVFAVTPYLDGVLEVSTGDPCTNIT